MYTILLLIIALFIPPLAVALRDGIKLHFIVNLTLHIFAVYLISAHSFIFAPIVTIAHAIWVVLTTD